MAEMEPGIYWYEDLEVGGTYKTPGILVTESHIAGFAGLTGDFFEVHTDDEFARSLGFKGRIAHGLLGLSMTDGLKNRSEVRIKAIASLGWNWKFVAPIHVGDRIQAEITIRDLRPTRKPGRGIVFLAFQVRNQDGELVQEGENQMMIHMRDGGKSAEKDV